MLRGGRAQREGACLGTGLGKQSSRDAAPRARSADHGISHDHNSVSRMVAAITLQIDALRRTHVESASTQKPVCGLQNQAHGMQAACECAPAGEHLNLAVGRSKLPCIKR